MDSHTRPLDLFDRSFTFLVKKKIDQLHYNLLVLLVNPNRAEVQLVRVCGKLPVKEVGKRMGREVFRGGQDSILETTEGLLTTIRRKRVEDEWRVVDIKTYHRFQKVH